MNGVGKDLEAARHGDSSRVKSVERTERGGRSSTHPQETLAEAVRRSELGAMPDRRPLACCLDVPDNYRPKAAYAVGALLAPLGLVPVWTSRLALTDGLYYGASVDPLPDGVLALRFESSTAAFFDRQTDYNASRRASMEWDGDRWTVLFPDASGEGDLIASSFFWLSGWQERTTRRRDVHGRFPYGTSLQLKLGCIGQPLVDAYRAVLAERLEARGVVVTRTKWQGKSWSVALTHDIDLLRKRRLGTIARATRRTDGQRGAAVRQALTAPNPRKESVERIAAFEKSRGVGATYFFKTAARGPWDVPYAHDGRWLRRTIQQLEADGFEIGLHPSYFGHDHLGHLIEERDRLAALTARPPTSVRQHFLRFDAATPRLHQVASFRLDSSLGFSAHEGFRRGTCHPFRLYDLEADAPLDVWELPLVGMDTTLFTHRGLDAHAAERAVLDLFAACRRVGGCCVLLWHNTLYDEVDYPGQAAVFERTLGAALAEGGAVLSLRDALAARAEYAPA